jgi:thymidylate synthase
LVRDKPGVLPENIREAIATALQTGRVGLDQALRNAGFAPQVEQRLCLHLTQRSCDLALGIPYNMASYGLLLLIFSHLTGIKPGIFAHTLIDLHIYCSKPDGSMSEYDHLPGLKKQMERSPKQLPRLTIDPSIKELSDIEALMKPGVPTSVILEKFQLNGYAPHLAIKFKVAV